MPLIQRKKNKAKTYTHHTLQNFKPRKLGKCRLDKEESKLIIIWNHKAEIEK